MKGKGPDPCNWGTSGACEDEFDLEAQHKALASWKAEQELAQSEQENKPDLSAKSTEFDIEVQQAAIMSWNKAHELAKEEPMNVNISVRALLLESRYSVVVTPSPEGLARASSPEGHVKVISPKDKKATENEYQKLQKVHKGRERPMGGPQTQSM